MHTIKIKYKLPNLPPGVLAHIFDPSSGNAEPKESIWVQSQSGLYDELQTNRFYKVKPTTAKGEDSKKLQKCPA